MTLHVVTKHFNDARHGIPGPLLMLANTELSSVSSLSLLDVYGWKETIISSQRVSLLFLSRWLGRNNKIAISFKRWNNSDAVTFNQVIILSSCHFINLSLHQLATSLTYHFINYYFNQLFLSSTSHFIKLPLPDMPFHQLLNPSTCNFINFSLH